MPVDILFAVLGIVAFLAIGWLAGSLARRVRAPTWCRLLIAIPSTVLLVIGAVIAAQLCPRCLAVSVLLVLLAIAERACSVTPFLGQRAGFLVLFACIGAILGFGAGWLVAFVQNWAEDGPSVILPPFAPLDIFGFPGLYLAGRTGEPGWIESVKRYEPQRVAVFNAIAWAVLLPFTTVAIRVVRKRFKTSQPKDRQLSSESALCASSEEVSS